jgi:hypothetical protein
LLEKKERLALASVTGRPQRLMTFLQDRVWPNLPPGASRPWTKGEERALGYGEHGEPV